jgi:hypothetical protein
MALYFNKTLQDGKLTPTAGRIVIYKDTIEISRGPSRDHNDLLRALASKTRQPKDQVISNATRLYWDYKGGDIVICPVRKIDEDQFYAHKELNEKLINSALKR